MTTTTALPTARPRPKFVYGPGWLIRRGPKVALREWRKLLLRAAWRRGQSAAVPDLPAEPVDPAIVSAGRVLRDDLIANHRLKHAATGYRVLMLRPSSLTAEIWFGDLQRCMQHAGIPCQVLAPDTPTREISAALESFQPNIFISTEGTEALRAIDLPFLQRYKRNRGCLRMLVPVWHSHTPRAQVPRGSATPELDAWRRKLRWDGLSADAHFSIFEPEFHQQFSQDAQGPPIDYVVIPMACNPFTDFPLPGTRCHAWFKATSMIDERVEVSYQFLRPILERFRGRWAGPGWGFGAAYLPPAELPREYSQTRVALNPLPGFVQRYGAEVTHRIYATAACGAFQLTMPTPITARYFRDDELIQARSPEEYVKLFEHYVHRPEARNAVALAALRRVYGEHTGLHRVDRMVGYWNAWRKRGLF